MSCKIDKIIVQRDNLSKKMAKEWWGCHATTS
jgi:hypothetical protein